MIVKITVISAELTHDTELIGKMVHKKNIQDPLVRLQLNDTIKRTKTIHKGGKTPIWNE